MNAKREAWSIVLTGAWNARLFTPHWLANNIFNQAEIDIEFPEVAGLPYRYTARGVRITPGSNQVVLTPMALDNDVLRECERQALTILRTLVHTPVAGVGSNFGFVEQDPTAEVLRLFNIGDLAELAGAGYTVESTEIRRKLGFDGRELNLRLGLSEGRVLVDFNFHRAVQSSADAAARLDGTIIADRDRALALLSDAYNFDIAAEVIDQ